MSSTAIYYKAITPTKNTIKNFTKIHQHNVKILQSNYITKKHDYKFYQKTSVQRKN